MLKICIVGPHQCGSTRLFNLVRLLYQDKKVHSCWSYQIKSNDDKKYDVIVSKKHFTNKEYLNKFDIVIMPYRDVRDAAISHHKKMISKGNRGFKSINSYITFCNHYINIFNSMLKHTNYLFKYEEYNLEYIKKLCQFLKINKTDAELNNILIELDKLHKSSQIVKYRNFKNTQYQKTLLTQSHNTANGKSNKYKTHFSLEENKKILQNTKIYNFLSKYGYLGT
jgi:hypothetical protein